MAPVLSVLAVAFAAVGIWLAVRTVNRQERWAKWTLAAVVAPPAIYVLSFWLACWLVGRGILPQGMIRPLPIYRPLLRLHGRSDQFRMLSDWLLSQSDDAKIGFSDMWISDDAENGPGQRLIWPGLRSDD
jgi:hypothetical protein